MNQVLKIWILVCLGFSSVEGQMNGIVFLNNDLQSALKEARGSGKIIFVDAYTTWCGPCKMMDQDVFSDSSVGMFYNENFVNLKLDMEKKAGMKAAQEYDVDAYPSFLFLSGDGKLLHKAVGYKSVEQFLKLGADAGDPTRQSGTLRTAYLRGQRDVEFLYHYANGLREAGDDDARKISEEYLKTQEDWSTDRNMELVLFMVGEYGDPYYQYIVDRKLLFIKKYGESQVYGHLLAMINHRYFMQLDQIDLSEVKKIYQSTFPTSKAEKFFSAFKLDYYDLQGDYGKYMEEASAYVKANPDLSWSDLNDISWTVFEQITDPESLADAVKWAQKSISKDSNCFNNDTLAALYYKLGKLKKAEKFALEAIDLAKSAGADDESTQDLLTKIRAASP